MGGERRRQKSLRIGVHHADGCIERTFRVDQPSVLPEPELFQSLQRQVRVHAVHVSVAAQRARRVVVVERGDEHVDHALVPHAAVKDLAQEGFVVRLADVPPKNLLVRVRVDRHPRRVERRDELLRFRHELARVHRPHRARGDDVVDRYVLRIERLPSRPLFLRGPDAALAPVLARAPSHHLLQVRGPVVVVVRRVSLRGVDRRRDLRRGGARVSVRVRVRARDARLARLRRPYPALAAADAGASSDHPRQVRGADVRVALVRRLVSARRHRDGGRGSTGGARASASRRGWGHHRVV
eukprot:31514-Pelagococcus_subviridis.AAC.5